MTKKYKEINRDTYNIISKDWNIKRDYFWDVVVDFVQSFNNKKELTYLDLGCGSGRNLELAREVGYDFKNIFGCDFSENLLSIVKDKGFKTNLSDLTNLNFNDKSFDVIVCIAVHHHLLTKEEQLESLKEMRRILKKSGKILLANWFPSKIFIDKAKKKGKFIFEDKNIVKVYYEFEGNKYDRFYYLFTESEMKKLCLEAGFKIEKEEHYKGNFYLTLK